MGSRYWIGTIFNWEIPSSLPVGVTWAKGQSEICPTTGRSHIQLVVGLAAPQRLSWLKSNIAVGHWEPTRSKLADEYVHKEATSVPGTRFELGIKAFRRNVATDWDAIRTSAKSGNLDEIPSDIYVRYYNSLSRIASDNATPLALERECHVFWGATGTGKSLRAWTEAGVCAYSKDPRSKWYLLLIKVVWIPRSDACCYG